MKTEKTNKQIAKDIGEIGGHMMLNGLKVSLVLFGGLGVFLFIAIFCAMAGKFTLGFAINSVLFLTVVLIARKIKNKKGENK